MVNIIIAVITLIIVIHLEVMRIEYLVKKVNKDQQEIKTRLSWLKERVNKIEEKLKVRG